jgi:hypothetical protein
MVLMAVSVYLRGSPRTTTHFYNGVVYYIFGGDYVLLDWS